MRSAFEHVAAGAGGGVRVVVAPVRVAPQARGPLDNRRSVRRGVAARACDGCVTLGLVQRWQGSGRMTALARRGRHDTSGAVRTVARRATAGDGAMWIVALLFVARGACG